MSLRPRGAAREGGHEKLTQCQAWGDVDALAEAGFCYAQGVGCKKDLKKSAKFYRMAEAKGMSMVGNSWFVCPVVVRR